MDVSDHMLRFKSSRYIKIQRHHSWLKIVKLPTIMSRLVFLAIKPIAYSVGFPAGKNLFIIIWWGLKFGHVLSLVFTPGQQINKRFPLTDEDAYDVDDGDDDDDDG